MHNKKFLLIEFLSIYYVVPLLIYTYGFIISPIEIFAILVTYVVLIVSLSDIIEHKDIFSFTFLRKKHLFYIQKRFYVLAIVLTLFLLVYNYSLLFDLPLDNTNIWLGVIIVYPLFSVVPQEIIYRTFFFERYQVLFRDKDVLVFVSALSFAFGHIIFHNVIAVLLTFFGGLMFAYTYEKRGSLSLVSIEHTLYGVLIFTLGFGTFFYHGFVKI